MSGLTPCRMSRGLWAAILVLGVTQGWAQTLTDLAQATQGKLDEALTELSRLREEIEAEKVPLARKLNQLEQQVLDRRQELERAQRANDNRFVELGALRREVERAREQSRFLSALLSEYVARFETRIHIGEAERYQEAVDDAKAAGKNADLAPAERVERQMDLLQTAMNRLKGSIGGELFPGKALTSQGTYERGQYALTGPVALFASEESEAAGIVELRVGSPKPRALEVGAAYQPAIRSITSTGRGEFPLDASGGNALRIASTRDTLWAEVRKGGPVMIPIMLLGFAALVICAVKWIQISKVRVAGPLDLQRILNFVQSGRKDKAIAHALTIRGPVGEMLRTAIEHADERKEYLEEVMYEKMLDTKPRLEAMLPLIALTAACAPLLGLLGTVTGMINTFNMITIFGAGDPRTLSGGISEALITTKFGLIVAVPALLIHAFITRKVKGVMGSMEQTTVGFINGVPDPEEERNPYV